MKLVILDRDGVINYDSDNFIKTPEEWIPIPGSLEAIARLKREGYSIVIATNQSGIARGLLTTDMLHRIHSKMLQALRNKGGDIDAIFFCPHGPGDGCRCRKPRPGMFEDITQRMKINLSNVLAVGDSERDVVAARDVMARPVLVKTGKGAKTLKTSTQLEGVPVFKDLASFTDSLLRGELVVS
ncbi:MAG: D-glycero-beta-D-manno-heptose 1,7-bisphosphate 7-phosphatase [Gammaproteobacteria bacterium]|nr:D-glycero-beta-D-manno-heptose 1,7-bisphosphate 7-phosphatase [Gammaproteobacteria bacterium]